jgi:hypothetical protein
VFPEKNLEGFLQEILPSIWGCDVEISRGPDTNGADLDAEFSLNLALGSLEIRQKCAIQAKSYEGQIGYKRALEDIRKAFLSDPDYTCGLIASTALEMTDEFEVGLDQLREEFPSKPVGVLIGKDLAYAVITHMMGKTEEA